MGRYDIVLRYSEEDSTFIAVVPALPGCMADGGTPVAAVKAAEAVIAEWIAAARKLGRTIPEPESKRRYSGRVLVRLPGWLHRSLDSGAATEGTSLNQYIVGLLAASSGSSSAAEIAQKTVSARRRVRIRERRAAAK